MKTIPSIAIVVSNTLMGVGLRSIIKDMMPMADIRLFTDTNELANDMDPFAHFFVEADVLMKHSDFFTPFRHKVIVLLNSPSESASFSSYHTIPANQSEEQLIKAILRLEQSVHHDGQHLPSEIAHHDMERTRPTLSDREIEVLTLIVKGYINKEIADQLNVALTTVISHRKNIMEKLNIHSVPALTIYAVMNGFVKAENI